MSNIGYFIVIYMKAVGQTQFSGIKYIYLIRFDIICHIKGANGHDPMPHRKAL
jgi:hypothetical protein